MMMTLVLSGHETTAMALSWTWLCLSRTPMAESALHEEVDRVLAGRPPTFDDLRHLPYAKACIAEAMRLYPPITFLPRVALEATKIGGRRVRKGALIMIAPWALHRHRAYWKNPDMFDPDRFSAAREGELTQGAYIPFGYGPRVCVGAGVATAEATLILARLTRRYEFAVADAAAVRPVARLTTRPAAQIMCRVRQLAA